MTLHEANTCQIGDKIILNNGPWKGLIATISNIQPSRLCDAVLIDYIVYGNRCVTSHEEVTLHKALTATTQETR